MIESFSAKVGNYISQKASNTYNSDAISYGCEILIRSLIKGIVISMVALTFGVFYETWTIIFFSALLRSFSGGVHCSTYTNCIFTSTLIFTALGFIVAHAVPFLTNSFTLAFVILSTVALYVMWFLWMPAGSENRPLTEKMANNKFKIYSGAVIGIHFCLSFWLLFFSKLPGAKVFVLASTAGMLWQGFTVSPIGYLMIAKFDSLTNNLKGGIKKYVKEII